ncbi:MAG: hypothetical protein HC923_08670 [Myxococcales bacterium]|nr:hypothetical protein [Myxococcales bacterium]
MSKPAARIGDNHICPMMSPAVPPIPHVGGPVLPAGCPTVLIGGLPAARVGDMALCVGPPDSIILGSMTVLIGGAPAARAGDSTAHGGTLMPGCMTVLIGDGGGGGGGGRQKQATAIDDWLQLYNVRFGAYCGVPHAAIGLAASPSEQV